MIFLVFLLSTMLFREELLEADRLVQNDPFYFSDKHEMEKEENERLQRVVSVMNTYLELFPNKSGLRRYVETGGGQNLLLRKRRDGKSFSKHVEIYLNNDEEKEYVLKKLNESAERIYGYGFKVIEIDQDIYLSWC